MKILVSEHAGFCYGVKRAVETVYTLIEEGKTVYTLGPLTHNSHVLSDLDAKGAHIIQSVEELKNRKDTDVVVIRAHGVKKEDIEKNNLSYVDMTCPFVKKIHHIVAKESLDRQIVIIGDKAHPEVIGISGWAKNPIIIGTVEEAKKVTLSTAVSIVCQTTIMDDLFTDITDILIKNHPKCDIILYNTRCKATEDRQKDTKEIAKQVDVMIVLGDEQSNNSKKLVEISEKYCKKVYFLSRITEKELSFWRNSGIIGITAGASTPPAYIKEAVTYMSGEDRTFEEMLDESFVTIHAGDVVTGTVIQIANGEVSVNLGYKSDGIIVDGEFSEDPDEDPADFYEPGDEIEVFVVRVNDGDGNVLLSRKRVEQMKSFDDIEKAAEDGTTMSGKITDVVKGGLIAIINGARAFVPSSQISHRYVEDLQQFIGKEFDFNILEADRSKSRIVAGRKDIAMHDISEKREALFEELEIGSVVEGRVNRIVDFGAFVDLGGADGLIHISELSWGRVDKVSDVLTEGQTLKAHVLSVDKDKGKISLSLKDEHDNPWNTADERYPVGAIVTGKVVRMTNFGAFVELEEGIDGLVHISQIADHHVEKPEDELYIGQVIEVKVTDLNMEERKVSLSKKAADAAIRKLDETSLKEDEDGEETAAIDEGLEEAEVAEEVIEAEKEEEVIEVEEVEEAEKEEAIELEVAEEIEAFEEAEAEEIEAEAEAEMIAELDAEAKADEEAAKAEETEEIEKKETEES